MVALLSNSRHLHRLPMTMLMTLMMVVALVAGQDSTTSTTASTSNLQGCVNSTQEILDADGEVMDLFPVKYQSQSFGYNGPADFFPGKFLLDNSTDLLTITYHKTYKIVTNYFQNVSYLLYQCGTEPPHDEVDSGKYHLILPVPHQGGVAITETPQIPPMELLGLRTEMIAYIGDPQYISSPCLNYMMDNGDCQLFFNPDDPWNTTVNAAFKEQFVADHPDAIIFEGPYGDKDGSRAVAIAASLERTNVATFDWIGLFAALYNKEAEANDIAMGAFDRYQCSIANAALVTADIPAESQKKVLWANYFQGYNWSVAECTTWDETYYCEYAAHCGVDILERPEGMGYAPESYGGNYWYVNDDELLEIGKDADIWIYPSTDFKTLYETKKEILDQFKAVQTQQVYDTQGQGPHGWYEQRLAEYDVVAQDVCTLVETTSQNSVHQVKWFRNIFTQDVGSEGVCTATTASSLSEPYVPSEADCTWPANSAKSTPNGRSEGGDSTIASSAAAASAIAVSSSAVAAAVLLFGMDGFHFFG